MRHSWLRASVLVLALGGSSEAFANTVNPQATINGPIAVTVLRPDGTPDPGHPGGGVLSGPTARTITVRDMPSGYPITGALLKISFAQCCDIELCSVTGQPGVSLDAAAHTIRGFTNHQGQFTFTAVGAGQNLEDGVAPIQDGCGGPTDTKQVQVLVNVGSGDILAIRTRAYVFNQDGGAIGGSGAVTTQDAGRVLMDVFAYYVGTVYRGRSDLNGDGVLTAADAGVMLQEALRLGVAGAQASTPCAGAPLVERPATCP